MDYAKLKSYRHADPLKVRQVWDALGPPKSQRVAVPSDKISKTLRKTLDLKDDQIRLLLDEMEGDGLIEKLAPPFGKGGLVRYQLPDFSRPCPRGKHDWYCFQCHRPGEVLRCLDCFRVYHADCAQEASELTSPSRKSMRSPTLHDNQADNFTCPVCESRPKCEFSRKQIRKLLEFATHHLRKQPMWKTFLQIGYHGEITKNEFLVYKYTDLELLQRKIKDGRYAALEEFSMDVQLLVHNVCILHGPYSTQADEIRVFLRSVNTELNEIQLCTDCYINAKARVSDWISKPCKPRHELIWARNRTPTGAGFFNDTSVSQFYWPAKILLERDDGYEIRFFGGTHERMYVKKIHTRPFHLPADEVGVLRRNTATGMLSGGGFERAWNEVTKLQANIDSGYYSHSSGESDLPPSDDDYSDELYLGPRRKVPSYYQRSSRGDSPLSSLNSGHVKSGAKRRRHTSSSSHQTTTSATPIGDDPSPLQDPSPSTIIHSRGDSKHFASRLAASDSLHEHNTLDKKQPIGRLPMPTAQPGTPGAAAISALAETKAAMAAAVGSNRRPIGALTADLLSLTHRDTSSVTKRSNKKPNQKTSDNRPLRGRRGRGRPSLRESRGRPIGRGKSTSSSSSHSSMNTSTSITSDSLSDIENDHPSRNLANNIQTKWRPNSPDWKTSKQVGGSRRGRPPKARGRPKKSDGLVRTSWTSPVAASSDLEDNAETWSKSADLATKPKSGSGRGRPKSSGLVNNSFNERLDSIGRKRSITPNKNAILDDSNVGGKRSKRGSKITNDFDEMMDKADEDDELTDRCVSPAVNEVHDIKRHSLTQRGQSRHSTNSAMFRPGSGQNSPRKFSPTESTTSHMKSSPTKRSVTIRRRSSHSSNYSSCSSSSDEQEDNSSIRRNRSLSKSNEDDRKLRSPSRLHSNKDQKQLGGSSTMLRRPPFAPPPSASHTSNGGSTHLNTDKSGLSAANLFHPQLTNSSGGSDAGGATMDALTSGFSGTSKLSSSAHPPNSFGQTSSHPVMINSSITTSNASNVSGAPGMSTVPRSHLPPNKRAAAAATAAALSRDVTAGNNITNDFGQQQTQSSLRISDAALNTSPRKQVHKGVQTPASMETPVTPIQQPCTQCREREADHLAAAAEAKKALRELEERLCTQFRTEKAAAIQQAMEQAQASVREAIEQEQKLGREALEAAEARFTEAIMLTKRRQWCRNCLSEAIYHCCWNTSYCSIQCQQEHWQKEHKRQCRRKR